MLMEIEENLKSMVEVQLNHKDSYVENTVYCHTVFIEGKRMEVLVFKYKEKFYCTSSANPYDLAVSLKSGLLIQNKLICSVTGSAFNITNGEVEYGPSLDSLAIFQILEDPHGHLAVFIPKSPPLFVRPNLMPRDYADLRKVLIVGGGAAGLACAEELRRMNYTGELNVISDKLTVPFDKAKLRKSIKHYDTKDMELRSEEYIDDYGINFIFGQKVEKFETRNKEYYAILENIGVELQFDAMLLATGCKENVKPIYRGDNKKNAFYFNNPKAHKRLKKI